jgi:hypothetical protein
MFKITITAIAAFLCFAGTARADKRRLLGRRLGFSGRVSYLLALSEYWSSRAPASRWKELSAS